MKLRPWQIQPANQLYDILYRGENAVDLSDCGVGKTFVSCSVSSTLGKNTLAVVPKISVSTWGSVAKSFGAPLQAIGYEALRTGRSRFGAWENQPPPAFRNEEFFVCESCQCVVDFDDYRPCHCHSAGFHCIKRKRKPWNYGRFIWHGEIEFLIADEVHRCSGLDSLNADILIAAKRQGIQVLGLSATAACTPLQMRALGYILGLHGLNKNLPVRPKPEEMISESPFSFRPHLPTFYQWAAKHDCRPDPVYRGLKWFAGAERQAAIMADIHSKLIPERGVRVCTSEIPDFPTCQISAELYDLEKDYEIEKLYSEMASALDALALRETQDVDSESPLTKILRARQRIELLKVPIFTELATDEMAKGNSVAIFVNFKQTIDELRLRLSGFNPGVVDGSREGSKGRDGSISDFQANTSRCLLLNSAAGGVALSLHDTHGGHPRVGLVSPGTSAVQFRQLAGRLPRADAKTPSLYKVILAARTVETKMKKALDAKLANIDSLNDSDMSPFTGHS